MDKYPAGSVWSLLLFQRFYDFDAYIEPIVERFPAFEKSAWCAQIKNALIETMRLIIATNKTRDKLPGWHRVDTNLELLKVYLRRLRGQRGGVDGKLQHKAGLHHLGMAGRAGKRHGHGIPAVRERPVRADLREQLEQRRSLWPAHREREQLPVEREREHRGAACL